MQRFYCHGLATSHALLIFDHSSFMHSTFILIFSFSKSYCLPGHHLSAITVSAQLLVSIKPILDMLQICPPCPIQLTLAPLFPPLRAFVADTAKQLQTRPPIIQDKLSTPVVCQCTRWITCVCQPSISLHESRTG